MHDLFNEDYLVCSPSYSEVLNGTVLPWLSEKKNETEIMGADNRLLYGVSYEAEDPLATVVIVHGFTENAFKYSELIWSLLHNHFSVIAFDQRGHGRSWRDPDIHDLSVTHVDHFSEYTDDLSIVCDTYLPLYPKPFFVFGHSMGGAVSSMFLEQHPDIFSAAVLSSPMIAPHTGGIPAAIASAVGLAAVKLGKAKNKPFFMKSYSGPEDFNTSCATDPARFEWYDRIKASRQDFQNSVPSYRWSYEALHVTEKILALDAPERISCPVLLFSAETDFSVLQAPQKAFIERVPNGHYVFVNGSRHEIFRSKNEVLFPWWHKVLSFYKTSISSSFSEGGRPE